MSVDKMLEQFKDFAELQVYAQSQYKTIISSSQKIKKLEDEITHLKKLIESGNIVDISSEKKYSELLTSSDEETISKIELNKLKHVSFERELTLEETKKVDIYSKILATIRGQQKTFDATSKKMDESELLKLVDGE
jgi:phenylalanine-4-hydroxylase